MTPPRPKPTTKSPGLFYCFCLSLCHVRIQRRSRQVCLTVCLSVSRPRPKPTTKSPGLYCMSFCPSVFLCHRFCLSGRRDSVCPCLFGEGWTWSKPGLGCLPCGVNSRSNYFYESRNCLAAYNSYMLYISRFGCNVKFVPIRESRYNFLSDGRGQDVGPIVSRVA